MTTVHVRRSQVMAAQALVQRAEARGEQVRPAVRKIAEARRVRLCPDCASECVDREQHAGDCE